jgi:hypothetical protein
MQLKKLEHESRDQTLKNICPYIPFNPFIPDIKLLGAQSPAFWQLRRNASTNFNQANRYESRCFHFHLFPSKHEKVTFVVGYGFIV